MVQVLQVDLVDCIVEEDNLGYCYMGWFVGDMVEYIDVGCKEVVGYIVVDIVEELVEYIDYVVVFVVVVVVFDNFQYIGLVDMVVVVGKDEKGEVLVEVEGVGLGGEV